jgi:hypothetical protein
MSFSRPIQWHYSQADLIWQDGTFNIFFNSFPKDECAFISRVNRQNVPVIPRTHKFNSEKMLRTRDGRGRGGGGRGIL